MGKYFRDFHLYYVCNKTHCKFTFGQGFDPPHFHQKWRLILFKIFIPFFTVIFLSSCAMNKQPSIQLPKNYQKNHKNINSVQRKEKISNTGFYTTTKSLPKILKFSGSGYIKGIINNFYYSKQKNSWIYYIKGTDFSNSKLKSAIVYGKKYALKNGELIYAVINNGKIASLYILKTSNTYKFKKNKKSIIRKKIKFTEKKSKQHRQSTITRQRKQIINAPAEEKITF